MKYLPVNLNRLQWKLTVIYTLINIVAVQVTAIIMLAWFTYGQMEKQVQMLTQELAQQATPLFIYNAPNQETGDAWLHVQERLAAFKLIDAQHTLALFDAQGQLISSLESKQSHPVSPLSIQLSEQAQELLTGVLAGTSSGQAQPMREPAGSLISIAPIIPSGQQGIRGAMVIQTAEPTINQLIPAVLVRFPSNLEISLIISLCSAPLAGWLVARYITNRFKRVSFAVEKWSLGDFSSTVHDQSGDELSQFTYRLNTMARQLQQLVQTRQKLAMLEERNRLARELHDVVKQQIFAISMQIGTALLHLEKDRQKTHKHLQSADNLAYQALQELSTIISELRPFLLMEKNFQEALKDYISTWSDQNNIVTSVEISCTQELPWHMAEALLRLLQEALSNISRHSQATNVQVRLIAEGSSVTLSINDNGIGFELAESVRKGLGLRTMRERTRELGGNIIIETNKGKGTTITIHFRRIEIR